MKVLSIIPSLWILFLVFSPIANGLKSFRYRDILQNKQQEEHDLNKKKIHDTDDVEELYLNQQLDHFDPNNKSTFEQRYFITKRYHVENAIREVSFLCVGGEGPGFDKSVLVDSVHCTGDMLELAQRLFKLHNICVHVYALEHRYYGSSYPSFENNESPVTIRNLKYLSSRQALEDLAYFVSTMNEQQGEANKWVTFGGSYPGYMAGNARLKYPHLINIGAISSSAPLELVVDFPGYKRLVGNDLKYEKIGGSDICYKIVKQGHEQAVALLKKDPIELGKIFHVCQPENLVSSRNQEILLGDGLIDVPAQSNDPSCKFDICNIERLCQYMIDATQQQDEDHSELNVLAEVASMQRHGNECLQVDWKDTLDEISKPLVTEGGWRSWLWQTCTEVGFYQTCDENCPFASFYHLVDQDLEMCRVAYNVTNVYENVQASLNYYGGLDVANGGSRVLFVNGNVDPWSSLGLLTSPKHSIPTAVVQGASHHAWTHAVQQTDASEITQVREHIYSVVMNWLNILHYNHISNNNTSLRGISASALKQRL